MMSLSVRWGAWFRYFSVCMSIGVTSVVANDTDGSKLNLQVGSPQWQDQIIYFLMIDRFNNGDNGNDDQGVGVFDPSKESHYSGGDIVGISQKLDYIQDLGATAVWLTPPVANQWWSSASEYAGYHGYWARHFKRVDEHYGQLSDYQQLSSELHNKGMYLIQDIVLNHTGIFFGYTGEYDPQNTAKNFSLYESGRQSAPEMQPFDMVNRLDPEHAAANIYNWTPGVSSYSNKEQQFTYQLGNLTDINTKNPRVLAAFKDAYRYWMQEVGVDAYRIDTVKYVEHEFWHHFLHDEDGIYPQAKALGKSHFLTFGEVFEASAPYSNNGEQVVTSFLGTSDKPELNSVIGFPLYFDINRVFAEGQPTQQLAYRLRQFMEQYPDPFVIPNFIDNHDTKRFLSAASIPALQQALTLIFTIPGIPVIYQGTEQALEETRQAMFAGGFASTESQFDSNAPMYRFIQSLANMRRQQPLFTRGDLEVLAANASGPGLIAYARHISAPNEPYKHTALILMNTAEHDILASRIATGLPEGTTFDTLLSSHHIASPKVSAEGEITQVLPARSITVLQTKDEQQLQKLDAVLRQSGEDVDIQWSTQVSGQIINQDVLLQGKVSEPSLSLQLVTNGNMNAAIPFSADEHGQWQVLLPIRDLGKTKYRIEIFAPSLQITSSPQEFIGLVERPTLQASIVDPIDDARGLSGKTRPPKQSESHGQMEILSATAQTAGGNLSLSFRMSNISDNWSPANGFDNVSFTIFFDLPDKKGLKELPLLNTEMPGAGRWDLAHVAYGWGNYMYQTEGASAEKTGRKLGIAPNVRVDKQAKTITFDYPGRSLGITDWQNVGIYATTWDIAGEGYYRDISIDGGEWLFAGESEHAPKVLDSVYMELRKQ